MLKVEPPDYKFCPFCGDKLTTKKTVDGVERKYCHKDKWTYYPHVSSAAIAVIIRNGKVLMVKRAREPYNDTWMFPAGYVNFGEHPRETAIREVKEETGLKARNLKLIEIIQTEDDPRAPGHFGFFYKVEVEKGEVKNLDKEENQDIGWFDIKNPPKIGWKSHRRVMKRLQEGEY